MRGARVYRPALRVAHLFEPHIPYRNAFELGLPWRRAWELATIIPDRSKGVPGVEVIARFRDAYEQEVRVVDSTLAELLAAFPGGPAGRIVIFTSDHGEEFLEHGGWEHGHTLYQELLAVPLVIVGIDSLSPRTAGLVDVMPTLLAALNLRAPRPLDGKDLARPGTTPLRSSSPLYGDPTQRAVRLEERKLIASGKGMAFYDLFSDPGERLPLAAPADLVPLLPTDRAEGPAGERPDAALRERIRSLGYVE